jgi:hypothetical protein
MVRSVQSARHQSLLAFVRRLDPTARHPRACRPAFRQAVPHAVFNADVDGQQGVAILLTYGPDRDWLKNLKAARNARMRRYGKTIGVTDPRVVTRAEAAQHVSTGWRPIIARVPFEQAVLLTKTG